MVSGESETIYKSTASFNDEERIARFVAFRQRSAYTEDNCMTRLDRNAVRVALYVYNTLVC